VNDKPFLPRRDGQSFVERDDLEGRWPAISGDERGRELKGVGRPQRMHAQEPDGGFPNGVARLDLVPLKEAVQGCLDLAGRHRNSWLRPPS
jgi:hypothetical protein